MMEGSEQADLHSIDLKVWRAEAYRDSFRDRRQRLNQGGFYAFTPKIEREGLEHSYYAVKPQRVPDNFSVDLGDCIHNLRSALDHLACHLVRISGGKDPGRASFPVCQDEFRQTGYAWLKEPCLHIDVRPDIRDRIDAVQPYKSTDTGSRLLTLHKLDIVDKHRSQIITALAAVNVNKTFTPATFSDAVSYPSGRVSWISPEPLQDGKKCITYTHEVPRLQVDPYLKVGVDILFGKGSPAGGQSVVTVLSDLVRLVRDEIIPMFTPFLGFGADTPWVRSLITME
jgi:hypothetical protein